MRVTTPDDVRNYRSSESFGIGVGEETDFVGLVKELCQHSSARKNKRPEIRLWSTGLPNWNAYYAKEFFEALAKMQPKTLQLWTMIDFPLSLLEHFVHHCASTTTVVILQGKAIVTTTLECNSSQEKAQADDDDDENRHPKEENHNLHPNNNNSLHHFYHSCHQRPMCLVQSLQGRETTFSTCGQQQKQQHRGILGSANSLERDVYDLEGLTALLQLPLFQKGTAKSIFVNLLKMDLLPQTHEHVVENLFQAIGNLRAAHEITFRSRKLAPCQEGPMANALVSLIQSQQSKAGCCNNLPKKRLNLSLPKMDTQRNERFLQVINNTLRHSSLDILDIVMNVVNQDDASLMLKLFERDLHDALENDNHQLQDVKLKVMLSSKDFETVEHIYEPAPYTRLLLTLNKRGKRTFLNQTYEAIRSEEWVNALFASNNEQMCNEEPVGLSCLYYFLRKNPALMQSH